MHKKGEKIKTNNVKTSTWRMKKCVCAIIHLHFPGSAELNSSPKKTTSQIKREDWKRWPSRQRYPEVNFIFTRKTQATTDRLLTDKSLNRLFTIYSRPPNRPQDKPFAPFLCLGPWLRSQTKGFICSFYLTQVRSLPYLAVAPSLLLNSVRIGFVKVVTLISLSC